MIVEYITMAIGGTILFTIARLPGYWMKKKRDPKNRKNTIFRLAWTSFLMTIILILISHIGKLSDGHVEDENTGIIGGADGPTSLIVSDETGEDKVDTYTRITMEEAKTVFSEPGDYIILDVRREEEYAAGHIPGAIHVANESITDTQPEALPDKNQRIYVYCRSGNRSKQASEKLVQMGYTNIIEFGGILDWTGEVEMD